MTTTNDVAPVVEVERTGAVGVLRLVDERRRNALSTQMRTELMAGFYAHLEDPDVRALHLTARGKAFCGGGDLAMMRDESDPWASYHRLKRTSRFMRDLIECPKPVVVGVNGVAVGGGIGLALAGDVILAGEQGASFVAGFTRLGLIPDIATMYTLPRYLGMARAKAFVLSGDTWDAPRARAEGLVSALVPDEELEAEGLARAASLAAGPLEAFGLVKRLMGRSFESPLDQMLLHEDLGQALAYSTEAMQEGLAALTSRREPDFPAATERENATRLARARRGPSR